MTPQQAADAIMQKCKPCIHNQDAEHPCSIICEDVVGYFAVLEERDSKAQAKQNEETQRPGVPEK